MPCLVLTGHPCSGKTTLAQKLRTVALQHPLIDHVIIINEESEKLCLGGLGLGGSSDNATPQPQPQPQQPQQPQPIRDLYYGNPLAEKQTRGTLKAAFDRVVGRKESVGGADSGGGVGGAASGGKKQRTLVILDSMNYIKGFRYELHCISKAAGEQHGVLWVLNQRSIVEQWNSKLSNRYSSTLLKELIQRYEPPDERNRWDKPLFTVDVSPATTSAGEVSALQSQSSTSSAQVLQDSVYNMHTLSDVLVTTTTNGDDGNTNGNGGEQMTDDTTQQQQQQKPKTKKSAFSRASGKKSAFTRKTTTTKATATTNTTPATTIIDGIPSALMSSSSINDDINKAPKASAATTKPKSGVPTTTTTTKPTTTVVPTTTLDEQLRQILDIFLYQTQALREGISTQSMVAGPSNTLSNLEVVTARIMSSILNAAAAEATANERGMIRDGNILQVNVSSSGNNNGKNDNAAMSSSSTTTHTLLLPLKYPRHVGLAELRNMRTMYLKWSMNHPPDKDDEISIAKSFLLYVEESIIQKQ